ncbi:MAG: hypothetical protein ACRC2S_15270 [Waterburya sp.]
MNTFDELDQYLNVDYNINYWSDDAMDYAIELIDRLSEPEWILLKKNWNEKSVAWQVRLADALFGSEQYRVIDLLISMLKSPEIKVAIAAAESLESKDYMWAPDASLRDVLEKLLEQVKDGEQCIIENLIAHIHQ